MIDAIQEKKPQGNGASLSGRMVILLQQAALAHQKGSITARLEALEAAYQLHVGGGEPIPRNAVYDLCVQLFQVGRLADAEARLRTALARSPRDFAMTNLLGVVLKNAGRVDEAMSLFDVAADIEPKNPSPWVNRGNIHLGRREISQAINRFAHAVNLQPDVAEHHRLLGVALRLSGDLERTLAQFVLARRLDPKDARNWLEPAGALDEVGRHMEALALIDDGLAKHPESRLLCEARFTLLRRAGDVHGAETWGKALLARMPNQAWIHIQLARTIMHGDRGRANSHLREAIRLEPQNRDAIAELADSLDRTRGPEEAANIAEAYDLALQRVALGGNMLPHARSITSILNRACNHEAAARVGSFDQLTQHWADVGYISALHYQMAQVRSDEDRRLLLEAHRQWGRTVDAVAARSPLAMPHVRRGPVKVRIGLMSSDLRNHPVSYFALPIIEHYDRRRFEIYCYSWNSGASDPVQSRIAALCDAFRLAPAISDRDAARLVAEDGLDMLIELGGTTYMNKLAVMAWRPARVQASWLGYPHSAGPETIDYLIVDPFNRPSDDSLLIERPLVLPNSWVVLGNLGFSERIPIDPGLPEERRGYLTFGTMNNPYKYTPETLAAWARVTAAVEGAHFLFVRPEGATVAFQTNIRAAFAAHGVGPERVEFIGVRGTHMPHYNKIDIALDTFPQTGGTTTCEALWMGVPTVTLTGPCFFERLSLSNLTNAGLGDLAASDLETYHDKAIELAADRERRALLRRTMREQIRRHPLGRVDDYVRDFMTTMASVV